MKNESQPGILTRISRGGGASAQALGLVTGAWRRISTQRRRVDVHYACLKQKGLTTFARRITASIFRKLTEILQIINILGEIWKFKSGYKITFIIGSHELM